MKEWVDIDTCDMCFFYHKMLCQPKSTQSYSNKRHLVSLILFYLLIFLFVSQNPVYSIQSKSVSGLSLYSLLTRTLPTPCVWEVITKSNWIWIVSSIRIIGQIAVMVISLLIVVCIFCTGNMWRLSYYLLISLISGEERGWKRELPIAIFTYHSYIFIGDCKEYTSDCK